MCVQVLVEVQVIAPPGAGVTGSSEYLMWVIEINSGPLKRRTHSQLKAVSPAPGTSFLLVGAGFLCR